MSPLWPQRRERKDAVDDAAVFEHVEIVVAPLAG
jgi:hypothetical protein